MNTSTAQKPTSLNNDLDDQNYISNKHYEIFCILWVIATFFHSVKNRELDGDFALLLLSLAGVFLVVKPQSVFRFFLFLSLQLFVVIKHMPYVSNHWLFSALVSATILQAMLILLLRNKSITIDKPTLFHTFAPVVRIEVIILYFFVVFHKLNEGFFNVDISCATDLIMSTRGIGLVPLPDSVLLFNSYFTIFIEVLIPLMLCFRKTRNWGILVGLLFHNVIAYNIYNGFYDFSSMIFALYFLFADHSFTRTILRVWDKAKNFKESLKSNLKSYDYKNVLGMLALLLVGLAIAILISMVIDDFVLIPWTFYSFPFIIVFLLSMKNIYKVNQIRKPIFSLPHKSLIIIPILVFINGMSPYLGLKTENSFAMFSNLRTEGGMSNHYIMPASFQVFNFQDTLVEVVNSTDPMLQKFVDNEQLITYFDFRHIVSSNNPDHVSYIINGEYETFTAGQQDHRRLTERHPLILRRLLRFRPINKSGIMTCSH